MRRKSGVKVSIGMVIERSEASIALKYRITPMLKSIIDMSAAGQNNGPIGGIFSMDNKMSKKGKEKKGHAQAIAQKPYRAL